MGQIIGEGITFDDVLLVPENGAEKKRSGRWRHRRFRN